MAKTKSAFDSQKEIDDKTIDVEWKKLTLSSRRNWLRVAAMFIGILMLSGIALAAIHISRHVYGNHDAGELQTVEADSISTEPKLYDNVPLGEIFQDISNHYNVKVVYQNEDAPRLRLFYRWKPEYTLEKVVEMMNNFEGIQIQAENDTLFIKTTAIPAKDC